MPPVPEVPTGSLGPDSPPLIWVGGTLAAVDSSTVRIEEPAGSVVVLRRLGGGATAFFRIQGDSWAPVPAPEGEGRAHPACVETLMDGSTLLALRVFIGATCGPA